MALTCDAHGLIDKERRQSEALTQSLVSPDEEVDLIVSQCRRAVENTE